MRKKRKRFRFPCFFLIFLFLLLFLSFFRLEKRLLPALQEISHTQCRLLANRMIDRATEESMDTLDLSALLIENEDNWTANTVLVNRFCSLLSEKITDAMSILPKEEIRIPLGAVTQSALFTDKGPEIPFVLYPAGAAKADYETAFSSVGINQVNYKIWLHISIELKIVNPFYQETIVMERKIMLADLIFSGTVPEHYFHMTAPGEYLLTE